MSDTMDDLKQQIEACQLALAIIKSMQTQNDRLVPLSERIIHAVGLSGMEGVSLLALVRTFDHPDRLSIRRYVRQLIRVGELIERNDRIYTRHSAP
jgi:hypothetical protein